MDRFSDKNGPSLPLTPLQSDLISRSVAESLCSFLIADLYFLARSENQRPVPLAKPQ